VVGLPCHVEGLRKLQVIKDDPESKEIFKGIAKTAEKLLKNLKFVISINCFANMLYGGCDKIYKKYGIKEEDVIKFGETAKKSLYQLLNEGKIFFWFGSDVIMTKDGKIHEFRYADHPEQTNSIGCNVCQSSIVCKEADVSIGITASELKLNEYGYNSVFVRSPGLDDIFNRMAHEGKLLKRPMWENRGRSLRKSIEEMIPEEDVLNFREYVKTKKWRRNKDMYEFSSAGYTGKIMGLQRLFLMQTVRRKLFSNPALTALKEANKFVTDKI
jgi:coenzyme F420-reducing hydrogenase beta subunit